MLDDMRVAVDGIGHRVESFEAGGEVELPEATARDLVRGRVATQL